MNLYRPQIERLLPLFHLLHQPDFYNLVANNAYQFVKQNYNWTETTKILENLLNVKPDAQVMEESIDDNKTVN